MCEDKDPQRCQLELTTLMDKIVNCEKIEYVRDCELSCGFCSPSRDHRSMSIMVYDDDDDANPNVTRLRRPL